MALVTTRRTRPEHRMVLTARDFQTVSKDLDAMIGQLRASVSGPKVSAVVCLFGGYSD